MNTCVEKGLSQGFLHCKRDYGSAITLRSKARGDIILREIEEAQRTLARFGEGEALAVHDLPLGATCSSAGEYCG